MNPSDSTLARLMALIETRRETMPEGSWTTKLLAGGVPKISQKVIEEAGETVEAAGEPGEEGRQHLIREAADLVYHLLVLLASRDVQLAEVEAELARREGVSGIVEKAARPPRPH